MPDDNAPNGGALNFFTTWAKENPVAGGILSAAIAAFASIAIIRMFGIDVQSNIPIVLYVIGIGLAFFLLASLLASRLAQTFGGLFVAFLVVFWITAFIWSNLHPKWAELRCAVYFWQPCAVTADAVALETAPKPNIETLPAAGNSQEKPAPLKVFIQFAGYDRPTIVKLARTLATAGWNVQGSDRGGERIATAGRLAEVRYGPNADQAAAVMLAGAVNSTHISTRSIKAVQNTSLTGGTLELWVGQ